MTAEALPIAARVLALLGEEHSAIRHMQSDTVAQLADHKEALVAELAIAVERGEVPDADLAELVAALRENAILLAFARDTAREALGLVGASSRAVRVSVSG